jgi:hypothetical protein
MLNLSHRHKTAPQGHLLIIFVLFCLVQNLSAEPGQPYRLTRWHDPLGRSPLSFREFRRKNPPAGEFIIGQVPLNVGSCAKASSTPQGEIIILVDAGLFPKIASSLTIFSEDLSSQGYSVAIDTVRGGTASDLRTFLLLHWATHQLEGAILVGDLPLAWFRLYDSWGDWEEFPIDYYFMDLDGDWTDLDDDGMFDLHTGAVQPEIWVGRLCSSFLTQGSEENLINGYLWKNHRYRIGQLSLPRRALAYIDDDWTVAGDAHLGLMYDSVTVVSEPLETTAPGYLAGLEQGYQFVHLMSHSSPWTHTFYPIGLGGTVYQYEIPLLQPNAFFYNLFACSNARWIEQDNIASWYIFSNPYGLLAVGTTKTGSMLHFEDFYGPLAAGQSLGQAFLTWMTLHGESDPSWFYGMTLLGDATLHLPGDTQGTLTEEDRLLFLEDTSWERYRITDHPSTDGDPRLAADDEGTIYLVWTSGRDIRSNIYESHMTDGTWSPPQAVCPHEYWDLDPTICSDGAGSVWIAWHSLRSGGVHNIFASRTEDGGAHWAEAMPVTGDIGYDVDPSLVIGPQGQPWVIFKSWRDGNADIYLSRYEDGWGDAEQITSGPGDDVSPHAARDGDGKVWIVWASNEQGNWDLFTRYVSAEGLSSIRSIATHPQADVLPHLVCDHSGRLWAIWQSFRDGDANIYGSWLDGDSWTSPFAVTGDTADDLSPAAAPFGTQGIMVSWRSNRGASWSIYQRHVVDQTWSPPTMVSIEENTDIAPDVCVSPQGASWIAWSSNDSSNWEIYAGRRRETGTRGSPGDPLPGSFSLSQNFPNPFNARTTIRYAIPEEIACRPLSRASGQPAGCCHVVLKIYNILGQKVNTLTDSDRRPGRYSIDWDGTDADGRQVSSGIYLYTVFVTGRGRGLSRTRKMVLLK